MDDENTAMARTICREIKSAALAVLLSVSKREYHSERMEVDKPIYGHKRISINTFTRLKYLKRKVEVIQEEIAKLNKETR